MKQEVVDFAISKLDEALQNSIFLKMDKDSSLWDLYVLIEATRESLLLNMCVRGSIGNDTMIDNAEDKFAIRQRKRKRA